MLPLQIYKLQLVRPIQVTIFNKEIQVDGYRVGLDVFMFLKHMFYF